LHKKSNKANKESRKQRLKEPDVVCRHSTISRWSAIAVEIYEKSTQLKSMHIGVCHVFILSTPQDVPNAFLCSSNRQDDSFPMSLNVSCETVKQRRAKAHEKIRHDHRRRVGVNKAPWVVSFRLNLQIIWRDPSGAGIWCKCQKSHSKNQDLHIRHSPQGALNGKKWAAALRIGQEARFCSA